MREFIAPSEVGAFYNGKGTTRAAFRTDRQHPNSRRGCHRRNRLPRDAQFNFARCPQSHWRRTARAIRAYVPAKRPAIDRIPFDRGCSFAPETHRSRAACVLFRSTAELRALPADRSAATSWYKPCSRFDSTSQDSSTGMHSVIQVSGVRKTYGSTVAVHEVSFEVHEGEIFGLIGPNGAEKPPRWSVSRACAPPT